MKKPHKLPEKSARFTDSRKKLWEEAVPQYLQEVEKLNKESARSHRFGMLLQQLLGIEADFIEKYVAGIEQTLKVKEKDRILRGEADNLFGNIIIEFEGSLKKKRVEAEGQLKRYTAILWSQEPVNERLPYLCIATDGVGFISYTPTLDNPEIAGVSPDDVQLRILEEADWTKLAPEEIFYWLDRYFLRQEILPPTSETIVRDFGLKSHALQTATNALMTLWKGIKTQGSFAVVYDGWEKYLRIVYGSDVADEDLFIRHTYLATLSKIMSWARMREDHNDLDDALIIEMLDGKLFKRQGIENFIEEDFFAWPVRKDAEKVGVGVVRWLFSLLKNYNLRELSEDVLKSLYQELVDPATRHDLGEFYTPDWLAHRIVNKLLDSNPNGSMLDPACGSGTFLYKAIREKRERLGDSAETLTHILDSVYGMDVHPLAVIVAKTNYLLALGDILANRKGPLTIPVYLADTIKLPTLEQQSTTVAINGSLVPQLPGYRAELDGHYVHLPEKLVEDDVFYDRAIEHAKEYAEEYVREYRGKTLTIENFRAFLRVRKTPQYENELLVQSLFSIAEVLKQFIESDRDTIWAFILKNIYKPLFLKRKFDFIMGNPPWISFRYMAPKYQNFLKAQITYEYKLIRSRGELITHMEVATLFFARAADLYLKTDGLIAFVMPKGIFTSDQHDGLRRRTFKFSENTLCNLYWREVWDCEDVAPLFNVPTCVVIADKLKTGRIKYPISGEVLSAKLQRKNASLEDAEKALEINHVDFNLHQRGKRSYWGVGKATSNISKNYYQDKFFQGATIVPRSFWFVQIIPQPVAFNPRCPPIETSERAKKEAKDAYKTVLLRDSVESDMIYATLLSTDLLPFGYLDYRMVVLPIRLAENRYVIFKSAENALEEGFFNLSRWLRKAETEWIKRRGSKAKFMNIYERLDRYHGITRQNPKAKYRVIYNTSGTYLTAAVVKKTQIRFKIGKQEVVSNGFLANDKLYSYETNSAEEANYLVSVFNSPVLDKLIKPMQSRGQWGPRDIHKKVLELPIPAFNKTSKSHIQLVELGNQCEVKVARWLAKGGAGKIVSIGKLRGMARKMLSDELSEIDKLVESILKK